MLKSEEENEFVCSIATAENEIFAKHYILIGGYKDAGPPPYTWRSEADESTLNYTPWDHPEPNDGDQALNILIRISTKKWCDHNNWSAPFMCEIELDPNAPTTPTTTTPTITTTTSVPSIKIEPKSILCMTNS